jgi:hypothetical protein
MRWSVQLPAGLVLLLVPAVFAAPSPRLPTATPTSPDGPAAAAARDVVTLEGCIRGGALAVVRGEQVGRTHDRTYRLSGPKELVGQLKSHHHGHSMRVTGRVRDFDDPRATRRTVKKVGKVTVSAEASRGTSDRLGSHTIPILDVVSFEHLSDSCAAP